MNATELFEVDYPHSHSLPKSEIIKFAEKFHNFMIKKDRFNTERFVANHSLEEIRKQFKKDKDHQ